MGVTLKDIAEELGLSYTTISRALSNHKEIKKSTRDLVKKTADEMGYLPNSIAQGLVMKKTKTLGLIIPDITDIFMAELAKEIEIAASNSGYTVFLCNTNWSKRRTKDYVYKLIQRRVDGIIILPTSNDASFLESAIKYDTRIIFIGSSLKDVDIKSIQIDNAKAMKLCIDHLLDSGKTKIAYLGGGKELLANEERFIAYKSILKEKGVYNAKLAINSHRKRENGYSLTETLLKKEIDFDAIIAFNDHIAVGALHKLKEQSVVVPQEVAVIGFDNIPFSSFFSVDLTSINQPIKKMAKLCIHELISETYDNKKTLLPPELIKRKTT